MNSNLIILAIIVAAVIALGFFRSRNSQSPVTPDGQVIAQLTKVGSDVKKPHVIDFFFYFSTQAAADRIAPKLLASGFTAKVDQAAQGQQWVIHSQKRMVPEESELLRLRQEFQAMAAAEGGDYDGWGAEIVK